MSLRLFSASACLIALTAALSACTKEPEFNKDDVEFMQETIADRFKKDVDFEVVEVSMMRVAPRRMEGMIKLKQLPRLNQVTMRCTATMSDIDENKVSWSCE